LQSDEVLSDVELSEDDEPDSEIEYEPGYGGETDESGAETE